MKTRVTFRVAADLAEALRDLPNQTQFVEQALREALRDECSMCGGTGRAPTRHVRVSNFRAALLPPLRREVAVQLKSIVALARRTAATNVELCAVNDGVSFVLARGSEVLLEGTLATAGSRLGRSSEKS
jgi:hypothetical protein